MANQLIYSSTRTKNVPIGLVLGDVFLSQTMGSINPLANSVQLRMLREEDKNHQHLVELSKKSRYFTIKVNGRFDIGSLMGFSGKQCYHFTMKTWIILFVRPRIFANGNAILHENQHNLLVQGDVRLVADHSVCNIYLLRGYLYDNGQFFAQNKEHTLSLNVVHRNKQADCSWLNMPASSKDPMIKHSGQVRAPSSSGPSDLVYVGMLKRDATQQEPIALISGIIHRAPVEPYRFGKSKLDFELHYSKGEDGTVRERIEASPLLLTIIPKDEALTSIYSTSGYGFTFGKNSSIKISGTLLIVDPKDGSLLARPEGPHVIEHMFGHLMVYVCDENIILLDNKTKCYQITGNKP